MTIYTMGFTQKSAELFFEKIKAAQIDVLIDIRLNNNSQLAGFSKGKDLAYFLPRLCNCRYIHKIEYAPTDELLSDYKKKNITWNQYRFIYNDLITERNLLNDFDDEFGKCERVLLLCSEVLPENCHRKLLAEAIAKNNGAKVVHI